MYQLFLFLINITYSTSSWILTTYLLTGAVMTPIAGKLSDIYGKVIIMIFYTAGVSIAGFSTNLYFMLIARGLQGVSMSMFPIAFSIQGVGMSMFPIAFSIVRAQFPRDKIAIGQGIITSMFAVGAVIGLTIGGFIIQDYGWHATFFTIIPIAIALLFIIWRFIHVDNGGVERTREQQQTEPTKSKNNSDSIKRKRTIAKSKSSISNTTIDVKGAITLAVTITSFLLLLTYLQHILQCF